MAIFVWYYFILNFLYFMSNILLFENFVPVQCRWHDVSGCKFFKGMSLKNLFLLVYLTDRDSFWKRIFVRISDSIILFQWHKLLDKKNYNFITNRGRNL